MLCPLAKTLHPLVSSGSTKEERTKIVDWEKKHLH